MSGALPTTDFSVVPGRERNVTLANSLEDLLISDFAIPSTQMEMELCLQIVLVWKLLNIYLLQLVWLKEMSFPRFALFRTKPGGLYQVKLLLPCTIYLPSNFIHASIDNAINSAYSNNFSYFAVPMKTD